MSLDELAETQRTQLASVLHEAVETISSKQEITFNLYVRKVLPVDGFVFWINAILLSDDALAGLGDPKKSVVIEGSLHRQVTSRQEESESRDENFIIFTPLSQCDYFNIESPNAIYLGDYAGQKFTFSRMESRYTQAGIFHYRGLAVLPTMQSQIIESKGQISDKQIVSSSLPAWLTLDEYADVYPGYLTPNNLTSAYVAVECMNARPLQVAPLIFQGKRYLLVAETVRATLQGFDNQDALNWIDYVVTEALETEIFGIGNTPVVQDGRRRQVEIKALDKSKVVTFEVNYYQQAMTDRALNFINEVVIGVTAKEGDGRKITFDVTAP